MNPESDFCLVTGACGFVGSHLVDILIKKGFNVRATDLKNVPRKYLSSSSKLEFFPANLTQPKELKNAVKGITIIFHTAGIFRFGLSRNILYKVNVEGSTNLFLAALNENISHFVNWSSAMIYGDLKYIPADENHPIKPKEPYSESKWIQEQIGFSYFRENGLQFSSIRPTAIYGTRSMYGTSLALVALLNGQIFGIPGNGRTIQHHVHVDDVVNSALFLANTTKTIGEAYNVSDEDPLTIEDTYKIIMEVDNKIPPKFHFPKYLVLLYGYLDRLYNKIVKKQSLFEKTALGLLFSDHVFDNTKLKSLGFSYSIPSLRTGIKSTIEWYRENGFIN